jgi:hypothetical protein
MVAPILRVASWTHACRGKHSPERVLGSGSSGGVAVALAERYFCGAWLEPDVVDVPDDVWFLTWPGLLAAWDQEPTDPRARIAWRGDSLARFERFAPPMIITSDGEIPVVRYRRDGAPDGALLGNPVSTGTAAWWRCRTPAGAAPVRAPRERSAPAGRRHRPL